KCTAETDRQCPFSRGSLSAVQLAPPLVVRSSAPWPTAQPSAVPVKSSWLSTAGPAYCLVQVRPPSLVARIRPAPAAQPWPPPANWIACSGAAPGPGPPEPAPAQPAAGAGPVPEPACCADDDGTAQPASRPE